MKTLRLLSVLVFLFSAHLVTAQITPEQKKQVEEAQKKAAEAQKQIDEMMKNNPQMKKMLEQAKATEEAAKKKQQNNDNTAKRQPVKKSKKETGYLDRYMISNSIVKKFNNWQHGHADIYLVAIGWTSDRNVEQKVGAINADGNFTFKIPEETVPDKEISFYFGCVVPFKGDKTGYENPKTKIIRTYLAVKKNDKQIGVLDMTTSKEQIGYNTLMDDYYSKSGYTLQWWYASDASSANSKCVKTKGDQMEMYRTYDLKFKPGWNLVKTEFTGERFLVGERSYFKIQRHSVVPSFDDNLRWVFH